MLGFAVGAPLIGLMLVTVVEMGGVVWQRELAAELLRRSVTAAARLHGNRAVAASEFRAESQVAGLNVTSIRWIESSLDGAAMLDGSVSLRPVGVTLLPGLVIQLSASAVVE